MENPHPKLAYFRGVGLAPNRDKVPIAKSLYDRI
jgi:hypothetical protein